MQILRTFDFVWLTDPPGTQHNTREHPLELDFQELPEIQ